MTHLTTSELRELLSTLASSLHPSAPEQADAARDELALRGER